MSSHVVMPGMRVEGQLEVPGDKSISHRALLVAAIAEGEWAVGGLSPAEDVRSTLDLIRALGVRGGEERSPALHNPQVDPSSFRPDPQPIDFQYLVSGGSSTHRLVSAPVDCGNSGTTMRLGMATIAGGSGAATLSGDGSLVGRPMARVIDPLRAMGAHIEGSRGGDRAPVSVRGGPLVGIHHELAVASAQVKSAILLAGLRAQGTTSVAEPHRSRDHTERMLRYLGVSVDESIDRLSVTQTVCTPRPIVVPGDLSSAAFLLVAAAILPGSNLTIRRVGLNPTRTGMIDILRRFGAEVQVLDLEEVSGEPRGTVQVRAADRRPVSVEGELTVRAIDELPLVAVLGAYAEGETVVTDAAELRVKESDRVAAIVEGLRAMGADVRATPDGFAVRGGRPLRGSIVSSAGDHRIAMALAVAALGAYGQTVVDGWEAVAVSYPGFEQVLDAVVVR